jgi:hypothetical protein
MPHHERTNIFVSSNAEPPHSDLPCGGLGYAACSSWPASRSISSRLSVLGIDLRGPSRRRSRRTWSRSDDPPRRGGSP